MIRVESIYFTLPTPDDGLIMIKPVCTGIRLLAISASAVLIITPAWYLIYQSVLEMGQLGRICAVKDFGQENVRCAWSGMNIN
jgi:hypothetical protein